MEVGIHVTSQHSKVTRFTHEVLVIVVTKWVRMNWVLLPGSKVNPSTHKCPSSRLPTYRETMYLVGWVQSSLFAFLGRFS
jgi:hypothetical protein